MISSYQSSKITWQHNKDSELHGASQLLASNNLFLLLVKGLELGTTRVGSLGGVEVG